ncbi:hypothetical protein EVAR_93755_1 [Eumeta japonica]|uniref:Uncharacterized protein n=1 Tax=Eumeta variegata TaxID=151549 RepID=A0A4C2AFJ4_EUMVA|nr:hypothetical protein EVAR_93755_1 [Eumeta japonica]
MAAVSHLAIDWLSGNWYLVDEGREVMYMCEKMLVHCRLLVDHRLDKVRGFAIDPTRIDVLERLGGSAKRTTRRAGRKRAKRWPSPRLSWRADSGLDDGTRLLGGLYLTASNARTTTAVIAKQSGEDSWLNSWRSFRCSRGRWAPTWGERAVLVPHAQRGSPVRIPLSASANGCGRHRQRQPLERRVCAHLRNGLVRQPRARLCPRLPIGGGGHDCIRVRIDTYLLLAKGAPPMVRALSPSAHVSHGSRAAWNRCNRSRT